MLLNPVSRTGSARKNEVAIQSRKNFHFAFVCREKIGGMALTKSLS